MGKKDRLIKAHLIEFDTPLSTGNVYPKEVVKEMAEKFNQERPSLYIRLADDLFGKHHFGSIVGEVESMSVEGNSLKGRFKLFDISRNKKVFEMLSANKLRFSIEGVGRVVDNVVQPGYRLENVIITPKSE